MILTSDNQKIAYGSTLRLDIPGSHNRVVLTVSPSEIDVSEMVEGNEHVRGGQKDGILYFWPAKRATHWEVETSFQKTQGEPDFMWDEMYEVTQFKWKNETEPNWKRGVNPFEPQPEDDVEEMLNSWDEGLDGWDEDDLLVESLMR